ncbi:MAG TPA: hypothetical protein PKI80_05225, partial [Deltaproteobacteria bacterium]|nr:hypothetical protein [Deltaproteobacteria bacterium]
MFRILSNRLDPRAGTRSLSRWHRSRVSAESRVLGRYLATNRYITLLKSPGTKRGFPFLRASIPERATSSTPMNEVSRGMKSCGTPASLISDVLVNGGL